MTEVREFHTLEVYLASTMFDVDGVLDDGWGASYPIKGREIEATVLFADITSFSSRTLDLTPAQTLAFVQNFFAWITAEALSGRPGIVDKYIGDEVMVVFSKEFGSTDPLQDAVQAAAAMSRHDARRLRRLRGANGRRPSLRRDPGNQLRRRDHGPEPGHDPSA